MKKFKNYLIEIYIAKYISRERSGGREEYNRANRDLMAIKKPKATASKKLWVFDFDDTLAVSKGKIIVKNAKGEVTNHLRTDEFKTHKLKTGESYDFSDFAASSEATPIRHWMSVLQRVQKTKESYMILTARSSASPARKWLETQGIRNPHIVAVGGYDLYRIGDARQAVATEKKRVVKQAIDRLGYTQVVVVDDSHQNIEDIQSIYGKNNPDSPIRTVLSRGKPQRPPPSKKMVQHQ